MQGNVFVLLLAKPWLLLIAIFCLGFSIFIHELGHYLAARWRGMYAPRFSIGFGPRICGWTDKHGTEFRLSWIPLGGYVALPQLADMGELEGGETEEAKQLPPVRYLDKVIVAVAGAAFNLLLAGLLATVLWMAGQDVAAGSQSTEIGHVMRSLVRSDGEKGPSPAALAGLQVGDVIRSIDGKKVQVWGDVLKALVYGSGRTETGLRTALFVVERKGKELTFTLHPELATNERMRRVGIARSDVIYAKSVDTGKPASAAGFLTGDKLLEIDGIALKSLATLDEILTDSVSQPHRITVLRNATPHTIQLMPGMLGPDLKKWGVDWWYEAVHIRANPISQVVEQITDSLGNLWNVINPKTDVRASDMGGPLEIVRQFVFAADDGVFSLIYLVLLINAALAVFNLMPIPVLDGGHVVFATIAKLRGRPVPINIVASIQSVFLVLLLSLMLYVLTNDVRRIARDTRTPSEEKEPAQPPTPPSAPVPSNEPAPAKP